MRNLIAGAPLAIESVRAISSTAAQVFLAAYLARSLTDPSLHPDAQLTTEGPQFAGNNAQGGVTLTQLRRFEMGLRGERVGGVEVEELQEEKEEGDEVQDAAYEDAEDMDKWRREQEEDDSAVDSDSAEVQQKRPPVKVGAGAERVGGNAAGDVDIQIVSSKNDKAARKNDKKARRKAEQKERAEKRRKVE